MYAIIDERQTGKTQLAIDLFLRDPENTIFIVGNLNQRSTIIKRLGKVSDPNIIKNIKPFHKSLILGIKFKNLIIDELFYKKDWKNLLLETNFNFEDIYIVSTFRDKIKDSAALKKHKNITITNIKSFRENHFYRTNSLKNFEKFYDENEY